MSLAFYASPIDFKNNDLETKLAVEKSKFNKNMITEMKASTEMKTSLNPSPTNITDIHKNLKEENEGDLFNFYNKELPVKAEPIIKTQDYMLINESMPAPKTTNSEMLNKLNNIIEMFEDQKEIKTGQKREEIILYCFLGVFVIYIMDSFVSIGKYSR
jgi:hypothetical protein